MWTDATADPLRCSGSGARGEPAAQLSDGYPAGRALCPVCLRFVDLDAAGSLADHDTAEPGTRDDEEARRRDWFNTHGW